MFSLVQVGRDLEKGCVLIRCVGERSPIAFNKRYITP